MISLLWQELVGGGIGKPPNGALHGDGALSLVYWTPQLLKIGKVVSFLLACEESSRSGLSGQMGKM